MIPLSFDPFILQDQLFKAIQNSPQTKNLISLRAEEIIKQIIQKPIQVRLKRQIETCRTIICQQSTDLENLKQELKLVKNKNQKSQKKMKKNMVNKLTQNENLFQKIQEQLKQKDIQIDQLQQYKQQLQKQLQNYSNEVEKKDHWASELKCQIEELMRQNEISKQKIKAADQQICKLQESLSKKDAKIQELSLLLQKTKKDHLGQVKQLKKSHQQAIKQNIQQIIRLKELKQKSRQNLVQNQAEYQLLKKQIQSFRFKYAQFTEQYKSIKQSSAKQISNLNTQIKHLNQVLLEKTQECKLKQKKIKKIEKLLLKIRQVSTQNQMNRKLFQQQIKSLKQHCQTTISQITDRIGNMINIDLQAYLQKLIRYKEQITIYRQQKKIKDEIIQKLEKMLQNETNGSLQLKNELRIKKKQEERLKKQLKRNYQQNDFKLQSIQKKYIQLLQDTTNYP